MPTPTHSSRLRYEDYRSKLKQRRKKRDAAGGDATITGPDHGSSHASGDGKKHRPRSRSFTKLLVQFWGLLKGYRGTLAASLIALSVSTLLGLVPLYGTKIVFDSVLREQPLPARLPHGIVLPHDRRQLLTIVAIGMVVLAAGSEFFGLLGRWQTTRMTKRVQVSVRKKVFDHAVRLPLHRVYELKSGGVASILREDAGGVAELIFSMFYNPWRAIIQLLGSLTILAFVDWRLLLGSVALLPTVWLTHRTWISRIRPIFRDIRSTRQQIDSHATEAFGGMRVVRSFSRQQAEAATFTRNGHLMARQEIFAWWWMRGIDVAWSVLIPVASALLLYFGGMRVLSDMEKLKAGVIRPGQALTLGDLVMFLSYLAALLGPIAALAASATALQNSLSGLDRVLDLLAEPLEMPSKPGALVVERETVSGNISLRNVTFAYNGTAAPVLHEINLDVRPGEMIALVGPSGAGKTTLCNLIARFYDPTQGAVLLDGVDLRDITADSYRRLLGIVEQDTFLFDGTIAENIAYGRRGATPEQIAEAAALANAHDFITKLQGGYDTLIGERGVKLSGGQRQRLTIARAILADPRILILDEATSNLDTESERLIQGSMQTLMSGRTSFVIAHRLSTIAHADRILVLENGRIVEQGRHEELMQASGRYRSMVDLQTSPPPSPKITSSSKPREEAFSPSGV
ncbi:MAG: putative multidrug export ATP-binding/permease protein [Phycisphaerales bacterium]|nr:putative multidrug export ATP-binding/permease protein [Phycisphaerales bacterium]